MKFQGQILQALVTFRECDSSMFRARKSLQPKIPQSTSELCKQLPATTFALHLKATVVLEDRFAVFFSDRIYEILADSNKIDFDGTFYASLNNFINYGRFLLRLKDILFL